MTSLLDTLSAHLDDKALSQLSTRINADQGSTSKAIAAALPLLLGALAHNASTPAGAQQLHDAVAKDHDGTLLDRPAALESPSLAGQGNAILGHILGDRKSLAEQGIARASGLDLSKVGPLLATLAPLVMGALGKAQRSGGLDAGGLASALGQERDNLGARAPGVLSAVTQMLDRNKDGSVLDDVTGMLGGFFGRK